MQTDYIQMLSSATILVAALLVALLPSGRTKPSELDLKTLACLEQGLTRNRDKPTLKDKAKAFVPSSKIDKAKAEAKPEATRLDRCSYGEIDVDVYMMIQRPSDTTGLLEFYFLCRQDAQRDATFAQVWTQKWETDIMEATKNCKNVNGDLAYTCAIRLLSQPSINHMSVRGLPQYIRYITPEEPVCDDEDLIIPKAGQLITAVDETKGPLGAMKNILQACIADASKTKFPGEKLVGLKKMEAGVKSHFGCGWIEKVLNKAKNQDRYGNLIVERAWITDCMRERLPNGEGTEISQERFKEVYGDKNDDEATEQLSNMITGIRCSTASVETAPDLYTALALVAGPLSKKAKAWLDNLADYVSCFRTVFMESDTRLGDLIGCGEGEDQYVKTKACTAKVARDRAEAKDDKFRLEFPSTGEELRKVTEKNPVLKHYHKRICRIYGNMKWAMSNPAEAGKSAAKKAAQKATVLALVLAEAVFYLVAIAVVLAAIGADDTTTITGFALFALIF